MTTAEKIQTVGVLVAALAIAVRFYESARSESRRTQPIAITHERRGRTVDTNFGGEPTGWAAFVFLTNDGLGPAFNVRFGVEYDGVRIPFKYRAADPDNGNRQRVLSAGQRLPLKSVIRVRLPSDAIWGIGAKRAKSRKRDGTMDDGRIYWCRYENTTGQTWETRNPGDRSADLEIRRIRFPKVRERYEVWRYRRAIKRAEKFDSDTRRAHLEEMSKELRPTKLREDEEIES